MKSAISLLIVLFQACLAPAQTDKHYADSLNTELKKHDEDTVRVNILNGIAYYHINAHDTTGITTNAMPALAVAKKLGFKKGMASAYFALGFVKYSQGAYYDAIDELILAVSLRQESSGSQEQINWARYYIALSYSALGENDNAITYLREVKHSYSDTAQNEVITYANYTLGSIYADKDNYKKAMKYYTQACVGWQVTNNKLPLIDTYIAIVKLNSRYHKYQLALDYANKGLALANEMGCQWGIDEANKYISVLKGMVL